VDYDEAYKLVKSAEQDYDQILAKEGETHDPRRLRRICEMILAREYDDWYWGDPHPNVSKAIHEHCARLARKANRPLAPLRRAAGLLAWSYVRLDHDSDDAFLLLEHVLADKVSPDDERILKRELRSELDPMLERWREDRGIPASLHALSSREREIWDEITRWAIQPRSAWEPIEEKLRRAGEWVAEQAPDVVARAITDAVQGSLYALQDAADWLTRDEALFAELREKGHSVATIREVRTVPIEVLDEVSSSSMAGGKILAGLEGAGTGAGGLILIAADVPAVMTLNLRFIAQIAHTYGFETSSQEERAFALNLHGAASADHATKTAFLNNLNKIAMDVARGRAWKDLGEHGFVGLARKVAQLIGTSLTKKKLAQLIPIVGAVVGGGVNYAYTHQNLEAARMMYRKRWLIDKCLREAGARGPETT
jgi:hypothetical protein